MTEAQVRMALVAAIDSLQMWFARKGYGWYEAASEQQRQQWDDRVREEDYLNRRLESLQG